MIRRRWLWMVAIACCLTDLTILEGQVSTGGLVGDPTATPTLDRYTYLPLVMKSYRVEYRHGDWVVTGIESVENATIYLDGNLFIRPGGSLTLTNITLMIEQRPQGLYQISAEAGSSLVISNCAIKPAQAGGRFAFTVQGAHFVLENSRLDGMKHVSQQTYRGGLTLTNVTGAILDGNTIVHPDSFALWLTDSLSNTITHNTIECTGPADTCGAMYLEYSHNNAITYNRLERQWEAIDMRWSWNNYVAYNELTLTDHTIGISLWYDSGNNVIAYNRISAHKDFHTV